MKTKEVEKIGEDVDIKFNENGYCVITLTDLKNFAVKVADQEKQALKEKLIKRFEEIKASGISMRDIIYLDGVLAVIETIDKE